MKNWLINKIKIKLFLRISCQFPLLTLLQPFGIYLKVPCKYYYLLQNSKTLLQLKSLLFPDHTIPLMSISHKVLCNMDYKELPIL